MANLNGQNIGTNYKGFLNLDSTINTPLDATLRAVTDGMGNSSVLKLSTTQVAMVQTGTGSANGFGIGTSTVLPSSTQGFSVFNSNSLATPVWQVANLTNDTRLTLYTSVGFRADGTSIGDWSTTGLSVGLTSTASARLHVKGSGTTSATTSLLVQNSAGTRMLSTHDDSTTYIRNLRVTGEDTVGNYGMQLYSTGAGLGHIKDESGRVFLNVGDHIQIGSSQVQVGSNSSIFEVTSTTRGFLPPRMTTTQKNAIGTPNTGLVVYDSTLNKLAVYTGAAWETVTSL